MRFIECVSVGEVARYCTLCEDTKCTDVSGKCVRGTQGYYRSIGEVASQPIAEKTFESLETQHGGDHYKKYEIEPVEFIIRNRIEGAEASIIRYACRHRDKNGAEDVRKIIHYGMLLLEMVYGEKYEDS